MTGEHEGDGRIKSIDTMFAILETLRREGQCGVTELAEAHEMPKSSIHRYLKTLEANRYVINEDGTYHIGFKFLKFGMYLLDGPFHDTARPKAIELGERTGESVSIAVREQSWGAFVYNTGWVRGGSGFLRHGTDIFMQNGWRFDLHAIGVGQVMLAEMADREIEGILDDIDERLDTGINRDYVFERVEEARDHGCLVDYGDEIGLRGISAAISDPQTDTIGALNIYGPPHALKDENLEAEYTDALLEAAERLNFEFRY